MKKNKKTKIKIEEITNKEGKTGFEVDMIGSAESVLFALLHTANKVSNEMDMPLGTAVEHYKKATDTANNEKINSDIKTTIDDLLKIAERLGL